MAGGPDDVNATPLHVAFVISRSDIVGGRIDHVRDLAERLRADGHLATVLAGGDGPFFDQLSARGIPAVRLRHMARSINPLRDVGATVELATALRRVNPNVLSLHTAKAGALGRLIAPALSLRPLYTPHGWAFSEGVPEAAARPYLLLERLFARLPGTIVNVCHYDRDLAVQRGVARARDHLVIHNGMPLDRGVGEASPARTPPRIVMVARFEAQKDHGTLLRVLSRLPVDSWASLELIGDGPLRPSFEQLTRSLGLTDRVHFSGAVTDVAERLSRAQLFVLTTHYEGFPRSVLEAMRAGLPVIATDVAGVREAVADGVTGSLVRRDDAPSLERALLGLLADADMRVRWGAAGKARFSKSFTFERMYAQYVDLYGSLVER